VEESMAAETVRIVRLVEKAKKGDNRAFDTLLKMVEPDLKKLTFHFFILGSDKEDVLQELRLGVLKAINSFDSTKDTTFKNFCVNLVCKRHLATAISSAKRMKNTILNESISLDAPIILGDDGNLQTLADFIPDRENPFSEPRETQIIDDILLKEELDEASKILKKKLTPLETEIFEEYGYDSTYKEISKNLNVPAKCVDNALTRIRKKATDVYTIYRDANHKFEGSLYREEIIVIEEYIQSKDKKNE
jgi:RNA polymerase sporulation-specific sigma factor